MRLGLGRFTSQLGPLFLMARSYHHGTFPLWKWETNNPASGLHSGRVVGNICYH